MPHACNVPYMSCGKPHAGLFDAVCSLVGSIKPLRLLDRSCVHTEIKLDLGMLCLLIT